MRDSKIYTIFDAIGITTSAFTAATTDIITDTAHGLKLNDMVVLTTSGTLPAGLALATVYFVIEVTTNTFKVALTGNGAPVDITDTGTGTHTWTMHDVGRSIFVDDFRNIVLSYDTDGGGDAAMVVKFQSSNQETAPDFSAAQSASNRWDYTQVKDLEDGSSIDGDTGITVATADDHRQVELNTNKVRWVNAIISGWTAGEVTVTLSSTDNR